MHRFCEVDFCLYRSKSNEQGVVLYSLCFRDDWPCGGGNDATQKTMSMNKLSILKALIGCLAVVAIFGLACKYLFVGNQTKNSSPLPWVVFIANFGPDVCYIPGEKRADRN